MYTNQLIFRAFVDLYIEIKTQFMQNILFLHIYQVYKYEMRIYFQNNM